MGDGVSLRSLHSMDWQKGKVRIAIDRIDTAMQVEGSDSFNRTSDSGVPRRCFVIWKGRMQI